MRCALHFGALTWIPSWNMTWRSIDTFCKHPGTKSYYACGTACPSIFGFEESLEKYRGIFHRWLNRTDRLSMHWKKGEKEKPDSCCGITWRRFWNFSRNRNPILDFTNRIPGFTELFAGTWRAPRTFNRHSFRHRPYRFHVFPARPSTSRLTALAATTTIFSPCRGAGGA